MTQIIIALTPRYVALVSDRRLTSKELQRQTVVDDDSCKMTLYTGRAGIGAFAYTGVANLLGSTEMWLGKTLSGIGNELINDVFNELSRKHTKAFSHSRYNGYPMATIWAGWINFDRGIFPAIEVVSNFYGSGGVWMAKPEHEFKRHNTVLTEAKKVRVFSAGVPLANERKIQIERIARQIENRNLSPVKIVEILCNEILKTASNSVLVGRKLLVVCIPKKSAETYFLTGSFSSASKLPNLEDSTFRHFDPFSQKYISKSPNFVQSSGAFFTNISFGPL